MRGSVPSGVQPPTVPSVYLDLNHWYALGRAMSGSPDQPADVSILDQLIRLVADGRITVPLSAVHYMELTENPGDQHRAEAAAAMSVVSRFRTMAPASLVIVEELEKAFNIRRGRPAFPTMVQKFGWGCGFAFGHPDLLARVGSTDELQVEMARRLGVSTPGWEPSLNVVAEYLMLAGPTGGAREQIPGYDPYAARRQADLHLVDFNVMVKTLRTNDDIGGRPLDAIISRQSFSSNSAMHWPGPP